MRCGPPLTSSAATASERIRGRAPASTRLIRVGAASLAALLAIASSEAMSRETPSSSSSPEIPRSGVRFPRPTRAAPARVAPLARTLAEAHARQRASERSEFEALVRQNFGRVIRFDSPGDERRNDGRIVRLPSRADMSEPDTIFRLAHHHLEVNDYLVQQVESFDKAIDAARERGDAREVGALTRRALEHRTAAKKRRESAVSLYQYLISERARGEHERRDEALYLLVYALGTLGRERELRAAYRELLDEHPSSRFLPEAHFAVGDYELSKARYQAAAKRYEQVLAFTGSPLYAAAFYKLAWCHLEPGGAAAPRYDRSLQSFIDAIEAVKDGRAGSPAQARQLRHDARRDLVRAYVHAGAPDEARAVFARYGDGPGDDERMVDELMERLAARYFSHGMYRESTLIYRELRTRHPADERSCAWQLGAFTNTLATDDKPRQLAEAVKLGQVWVMFRDGDYRKSRKRDCRGAAFGALRQLAALWHAEADSARAVESYDLADQAYQSIFAMAHRRDQCEARRDYAEMLWTRAARELESDDRETRARGRQRFKTVHEQFVSLLECDPDGAFAQDAAYAQMLAMKNYLDDDEAPRRPLLPCQINAVGACVER